MKVEVIEKRDNEIVVKFKGNNAMDAVILGMMQMGVAKDESTLSSTSGSYTKGMITVGSWSIAAISAMTGEEPKL